MKMKLNLKKEFIGLNGLPLIDGGTNKKVMMNETLANNLAIDLSEDPIKMLDIAKELYKGSVELDESDMNKLEAFIKKCKFTNIVKAQLLKEINKVKLKAVDEKAKVK